MATTKKDLDEIAAEYHGADKLGDKHIEDAYQARALPWVLRQLAGCERVLEMGYGEGNFTEELVRNKFRPTLLEGSQVLAEQARQKFGAAVDCRHSMFEDFTVDRPFDAVIASHVLEHVDDPVRLLLKVKQWIAPSGKVIIIVPNKQSIHRQLAVLMGLQPALDTLGVRDKLVGHQRVYSIATLKADVEKAGLRILESKGFFLKVLPNSMMIGYSKELLAALNQISMQIPDELLANIGMVAAC